MRMEALVVGQVQGLAVVLANEIVVGVVRQVGMDADRAVVGDGEPVLVERPVVLFAEAEAVAQVISAALGLGVDVRGLHDGRPVARSICFYSADDTFMVVNPTYSNPEGLGPRCGLSAPLIRRCVLGESGLLIDLRRTCLATLQVHL